MRSFDVLLQKDINSYEGRYDDLISQAPALYRLLTKLLDDPRLPKTMRPLVLAAIAYFILPVDIIPEEIEGPYGYIDDIWLCSFVADRVRKEVGTEGILVDNWDGEGRIIQLVQEVLEKGHSLIGDKENLILDYIGFKTIAVRQEK